MIHDSLKAEVACLHGLFHLVKFQKARSGAEDIRPAFPLINRLSVHQDVFAVGARHRQILRERCSLGLSLQGEH